MTSQYKLNPIQRCSTYMMNKWLPFPRSRRFAVATVTRLTLPFCMCAHHKKTPHNLPTQIIKRASPPLAKNACIHFIQCNKFSFHLFCFPHNIKFKMVSTLTYTLCFFHCLSMCHARVRVSIFLSGSRAKYIKIFIDDKTYCSRVYFYDIVCDITMRQPAIYGLSSCRGQLFAFCTKHWHAV